MKMKYLFIYVFAALLLSSCTKDFLQKDPLGQENSGAFFRNEIGCEQGVGAIYDPMGWKQMYSVNYWVLGDVCSDDCEKGGQNAKDQLPMQELATFGTTPSNVILNDLWEGFYIGIGRANLLLYETESADDVDFDNDIRLSFRAEARFLRALYYFDLMKIFGAVPLVTGPVIPGEGSDIGNRQEGDEDGVLQKQAVMDFIIAELEEIQDVQIKQTAKGHVTNRAINALLAKAYLWNEQWVDALASAEKVIDMSPALTSVKYQEIFSLDNEGSSEVIFAVQFVDGDDYDRNAEGSERSTYQNVRLIKNMDDGNSYFMGVRGYGFNIPTEDLVKTFKNTDPRLDMILSQSDKDSIWVNFSEIDADKYPDSELRKHPIIFPSKHTGYYCRKNVLEYNEFAVKEQSSALDYPLIRLADVYLIAAEAAFESGNTSKATDYVNAVRERARKSGRVELGFKKYEYFEADEPQALGSVSIDDIYKERRMELFCEGHRFFDLVRTGRVSQTMSKVKFDSFGAAIQFTQNKNEVFPIPQNEIIKHIGGNLIQNPNY